MKKKTVLVLVMVLGILFLSGCGEEEGEGGSLTTTSVTSTSGGQGWHFQGRDCLACHNTDLKKERHLLIGATLYKESNVSNQDDVTNACGGKFVINFLDSTSTTVYSSKDYEDSTSKGYNAKGNIFILQRTLRLLDPGIYRIQITDEHGVQLAHSRYSHQISSQDYDINNNADINNRLSCNACHVKGGVTLPLYVQYNKNLCK